MTKEFKRMLEYILAMFPQSRGEEHHIRLPRSLFEGLFASDPSPSDQMIPPFVWFDRVKLALEETDIKVSRIPESRKGISGILSGRKPLYRVSGNPSGARAAALNEELEAHLDRKIPSHRLVGVTIADICALESSFRAQTEALSHSM